MSLWLSLLLASLYVFAVIGVAEALRHWRQWESAYTRKVVHIGVGMLIWLVPILFETWQPFVLTCAAFSIMTFLDNRYHFFKSMARPAGSTNWGTFYFPLAAAIVVWWFWEQPAFLVAAMMPLTWGDGMAEVVGRKFGRNHYTIFNHTRSFEGSTAYILFGLIFTFLALIIFTPPALTVTTAFTIALVVILITSVIEAVSIAGLDNLTITATALIILTIWPQL